MKQTDQLTQRPENRWQNMLAAGDPRAADRQCTAKSKQTGQRCRNAARKGKTVCGYHGVARFDRITPEIADRRARASMAGAAEETLGHAIAEGLLHEDTRAVFRRDYAARVPQHLHATFLLQLDARLRGRVTTQAWRRAVARFVAN